MKEIFMIDFGEKSAPTHGSCLQPMFPPSLENHLNILLTIFTLTRNTHHSFTLFLAQLSPCHYSPTCSSFCSC